MSNYSGISEKVLEEAIKALQTWKNELITVDDILDIESTSKQLGKPAFSDYKEGKVTLPYIYAYKALNENDKQKFKSMHKIELCIEDENWIKSKLNETGAITDVKNLINQKSSLALKAIESENNNSLVDIIKQVTMRIY
jgi:octaprenyl-diphosphate synthase